MPRTSWPVVDAKGRELTEAEIARAHQIKAALRCGWGRVAKEYYGVSPQALRMKIGLDLATRQAAKERARGHGLTRDHGAESSHTKRDDALFDPHRDGYPEYDSPTASFHGDPPRGRRELLEANAARTASRDPYHTERYWRF